MRHSLHPDRYAKVRIVVEVLVPEYNWLYRKERMGPVENQRASLIAIRNAMGKSEADNDYKLLSAKRTRVVGRDLNHDGFAVITPGPEDSDDCEADATDRDDRALLGDDHDDPADDGFSDAITDSPVILPDSGCPLPDKVSWDFVIA